MSDDSCCTDNEHSASDDESQDSLWRLRPEMSRMPLGETTCPGQNDTTNHRQRVRQVATSKNSTGQFQPVQGPLGDSNDEEGFQHVSGDEDYLAHVMRVRELQQRNVDNCTTSATSVLFTTANDDDDNLDDFDDEEYTYFQTHASDGCDQATRWQRHLRTQQKQWSQHRPMLLAEALRAEAIPPVETLCACGKAHALIKCLDCCVGGVLLCSECDQRLHPDAHFHRRQVWDNSFFSAIPSHSCFPLPDHPPASPSKSQQVYSGIPMVVKGTRSYQNFVHFF